jgi:hypothetical protein
VLYVMLSVKSVNQSQSLVNQAKILSQFAV